MASMIDQATQTKDEEPENTQSQSVNIYHIPMAGSPNIVPLTSTYDYSNPGVRIKPPYNTNGIIIFSGLFDISERHSIDYQRYTVNPELPPNQMAGYWEDCDPLDGPQPQPEDSWVTEYQIIFDEEGIPKNLAPNATIANLRGDVFVVKRLYNTETCSEVPLSIEESEIPTIRNAIDKFERTVLCPSIRYLHEEILRIWRQHVQPTGVMTYMDFMNEKYRCCFSFDQTWIRVWGGMRTWMDAQFPVTIHLTGNTTHERMESLNQFIPYFARRIQDMVHELDTNISLNIPVTQWIRRQEEVAPEAMTYMNSRNFSWISA